MSPCTPSRHRARAGSRACGAALVVAVTLVASAGPAGAARHVVRPGETLIGIAANYGTTVSTLVSTNGIANPNRIVAGQVLDVPTRAPAPSAVVHRVKAGETLFDIARRYRVSVAAIVTANGIVNPNVVRIGQQLMIPGAAGAGSNGGGGGGGQGSGGGGGGGTASSTTHTVKAGETLAGIAARYGVTARAIAEANGLTNPNLLRIGQQLTIPAPSGGGGGGASFGGTSAYAATGGADGQTGVPGDHTVGWGESIDDIADQYGVSVEDLAAANGLLPPYNLYAGSNLLLSAPNELPTNIAVCPVPGARFANDWRFPRAGDRTHAGNDMLAPKGTPVLAPVDGEVITLTGPVGGRQFELFGDDDTRYIGAHLDEFGETGRVQAGDVIGYVGMTGNAVGVSHLHFEIHPDHGAAMNPYPVLVKACR